ncbi:hypothetical protein ACVIHC_005436 [Bradyrhizobium diazoefficiens]
MVKKLWAFAVDFWRDGNVLLGFVAAPLSIAFTLAKALDVPALSHLREVSYAWALAPLLIWVLVAYVRRRSHSISLAPKLKCTFDMAVPGCVNPNIDMHVGGKPHKAIRLTWYRVKVEADSPSNIQGCTGRLLSVKRGDTELLHADAPVLPFTPGTDPDATSKTIRHGVPEFLDVLSANATNGVVHLIKGHRSAMVDWDKMFSLADDYYLKIAITSDSPTVEMVLKFKWTLDPATSVMIAIR